ncbi:Stm1p NDAI_0J00740 [Naumovozyma dairenensis CBS 421]|uniref:Hyaluronan/mRNA-binding protein domain-containing protein n=1 Tax=Naumovozyma dairenensis (strain ATCC 10597 / BCRC 20456 / CBS 421 / NBRC 0211 / NRRL Y-12639) TaxID=1071378 RepID=G0WGN8_NAUDC|nr:hypothetical protein NDAI_0J00740 [Naumovozyma dairenensis CBS 421]CCD26966.1 hypothetical protein NDAI_0J00740 [Naumovozyma dairenensis CBS 421]
MSTNPFDLLGNDVEDPSAVVPPVVIKEIVKNTTSSKKTDTPPKSADPSKARKNRPRASGNEGAIKDKSAGRYKNKSKDVPSSAATNSRDKSRRATDRHSRSGKADTEKKVNQGWGDNNKELSTEIAAEADAAAEIEADKEVAEEDAGSQKMSLQDYLKSSANTELNKVPEPTKNINKLEGAELFVKKEEDYVPATKTKNVKSKQLKTKNFLDFSATFSDSLPQQKGGRKNFNGKGDRRGGKSNNNRQGKRSDANPVQRNASIDTSNLPSLA